MARSCCFPDSCDQCIQVSFAQDVRSPRSSHTSHPRRSTGELRSVALEGSKLWRHGNRNLVELATSSLSTYRITALHKIKLVAHTARYVSISLLFSLSNYCLCLVILSKSIHPSTVCRTVIQFAIHMLYCDIHLVYLHLNTFCTLILVLTRTIFGLFPRLWRQVLPPSHLAQNPWWWDPRFEMWILWCM